MFRRDVLVLEVRRFLEGLVEDAGERLACVGLRGRSCHARQFFLDGVQFVFQPLGGHADFLQHGGDHALAVFKQSQQQVHGLHFGVAEFGCARLRLLHCLLRLDGEFFPTNGHEKQLLASSF